MKNLKSILAHVISCLCLMIVSIVFRKFNFYRSAAVS